MMTTTQQDKPGGKPRQRSRKADQRRPKGEQRDSPARDLRDEDQIRPMAASEDAPAIEAVVDVPAMETVTDVAAFEAPAPVETPLVGEVLPPVTTTTGVAGTADVIGLQTIANAYADYARTSLQESRSFVEKFMGVRTFDKAIELQGEFARQAYANFVAESQKICGLYSRWALQILWPWEIAATRLTGGRPQSW
jgi:hypothetical protein